MMAAVHDACQIRMERSETETHRGEKIYDGVDCEMRRVSCHTIVVTTLSPDLGRVVRDEAWCEAYLR